MDSPNWLSTFSADALVSGSIRRFNVAVLLIIITSSIVTHIALRFKFGFPFRKEMLKGGLKLGSLNV